MEVMSLGDPQASGRRSNVADSWVWPSCEADKEEAILPTVNEYLREELGLMVAAKWTFSSTLQIKNRQGQTKRKALRGERGPGKRGQSWPGIARRPMVTQIRERSKTTFHSKLLHGGAEVRM